MKNLAILMTALTIFGVQTSGIASEQLMGRQTCQPVVVN
jgi:hypothetical protein